MSTENFCTYMNQECNQTLDGPHGERSVWWHIRGIAGQKDPDSPDQKVGYIDTNGEGKVGRSMYQKLTPKKIAKRRSEGGGIFRISHTCKQCRKNVEGVFELWEENEALLKENPIPH